MKKRVFVHLVRHGQTKYNLQRVADGVCPDGGSELTDLGKQQATELGRFTMLGRFDLVQESIFLTSGFKRTNATFEDSFGSYGAKATVLELLREQHMGIWEKQSWRDIDTKLIRDWLSGTHVPEGGEHYREVADRSERVLEHVLETAKQTDKSVFWLFTHGNFIRAMIGNLLTAPISNWQTIVVDNTSVTTLVYRPKRSSWYIDGINNTSHLSYPCRCYQATKG